MIIWIKNPLAIWTGTKIDAGGGVVVDGQHIAKLIPGGQQPSQPDDEVLNAQDLVVIPGLVNCHYQFFQTLTRTFPGALNKELYRWLKILYPVWQG